MSIRRRSFGAFTAWRVAAAGAVAGVALRLLVTVMAAIALGVALRRGRVPGQQRRAQRIRPGHAKAHGRSGCHRARAARRFLRGSVCPLGGRRRGERSEPRARTGRRGAARAGCARLLEVLGVDLFRAAALQPAFIGEIGAGVFALFRADGIYLSSRAAEELELRRGDTLQVIVGSSPKALRVLGILSEGTYPQALGLMDIASAQWTFNRIGRLNRIDLRLRPGSRAAEAFRRTLGRQRSLEGVLACGSARGAQPRRDCDTRLSGQSQHAGAGRTVDPARSWSSSTSISLAGRAAVQAPLVGIAAGAGRDARANCNGPSLHGEGAALGVAGSFLGVILGSAFAAAILRSSSGEIWATARMRAAGASLVLSPGCEAPLPPCSPFLRWGRRWRASGAWSPARNAQRGGPRPRLSRAATAATSRSPGRVRMPASLLLGLGAALSRLPPMGGLPVSGYAAIAALLFGAGLLVPTLTVKGLSLAPRTHRIVLDTAVAQLRENVDSRP